MLILTSGAHRVDTDKVAADHRRRGLKRAKPEFVREHTGQVIGGVSPIAHPAPVPTYLDSWLREVRRGLGRRRPSRGGLLHDLRRAGRDDGCTDHRGGVMEIWLNPACSKCQTAVTELDAAGVDYTVRRYLDDPPTAAELAEVLDRLGLEPWDIARDKEAAEEGIDLPRDAGAAHGLARGARRPPEGAPAPDHHRRRRHDRRWPRPRLPGHRHRRREVARPL